MMRRWAIVMALGGLAVSAFAADAPFPNRPVRMLIPYPAGGGVDIAGRAIAQQLAANFGVSVIVDNRPGAGGTIGTDHVAKAAPDGYTLLVSGRGPLAAAPLTNPNLPYVTARDIAAVSNLVTAPYLLSAHPSVPAANARELIALAKAQPGRLNVVSGGAGGGQHIAAEEFNLLAHTRMTHVAYKGTAPAITDLIGGHADLGFLDAAALPQILSGRLKALGVSGTTRYEPLPNVPTIAESGLPGYDVFGWNGVLATAGTPRPVIEKLHALFVTAMKDPEVRTRMAGFGFEPIGNSPEEFGAFVKEDIARWAKLVKETGAKVE